MKVSKGSDKAIQRLMSRFQCSSKRSSTVVVDRPVLSNVHLPVELWLLISQSLSSNDLIALSTVSWSLRIWFFHSLFKGIVIDSSSSKDNLKALLRTPAIHKHVEELHFDAFRVRGAQEYFYGHSTASQFPNLHTLYLSNHRLAPLYLESILQLPNLTKLHLRRIKLPRMSGIRTSGSLRHISLEYTKAYDIMRHLSSQISSLRVALDGATTLQCDLSDIFDHVFPKLTIVDIEDSYLFRQPYLDQFFHLNPNITNLSLSSSIHSECLLSPAILPRLQKLAGDEHSIKELIHASQPLEQICVKYPGRNSEALDWDWMESNFAYGSINTLELDLNDPITQGLLDSCIGEFTGLRRLIVRLPCSHDHSEESCAGTLLPMITVPMLSLEEIVLVNTTHSWDRTCGDKLRRMYFVDAFPLLRKIQLEHLVVSSRTQKECREVGMVLIADNQ